MLSHVQFSRVVRNGSLFLYVFPFLPLPSLTFPFPPLPSLPFPFPSFPSLPFPFPPLHSLSLSYPPLPSFPSLTLAVLCQECLLAYFTHTISFTPLLLPFSFSFSVLSCDSSALEFCSWTRLLAFARSPQSRQP